jgi:hypothetical protein
MAKRRSNPRFHPPTRAKYLPTIDRAPTRSTSLHFIALKAGETTKVVKATHPSHPPANITCSVWMTTPNMRTSSFFERPRPNGPLYFAISVKVKGVDAYTPAGDRER